MAWFHTSTHSVWPPPEAAARDRAIHLGTYEAAVDNMFYRMSAMGEAHRPFYLHRVVLPKEVSIDPCLGEDCGQTFSGIVDLRVATEGGHAGYRYVNREEHRGSVSLAIDPIVVTAVQTIALPRPELRARAETRATAAVAIHDTECAAAEAIYETECAAAEVTLTASALRHVLHPSQRRKRHQTQGRFTFRSHFMTMEHAEAVEVARANGAYEQIRNPLIIADHLRPFFEIGGARVYVAKLTHAERLRTFMDKPDGLKPIALWLNANGLPSKPSAWQEVFKTANGRCANRGVTIRCHPHMLRHSFAVITLEQLWRGHIQELAAMSVPQRETYQRVFGDPLNWVRIRMGVDGLVIPQG